MLVLWFFYIFARICVCEGVLLLVMFAVTVWLVLVVCLFVVSGRFGFPVVFGLSIALLFCGLILVAIVVWVLVV